jgi:hypothetical protein
MRYLLLLLLFGCPNISCMAQSAKENLPESFTIVVSNPLNEERESILVTVSPSAIRNVSRNFNSQGFLVMDGKTEVPSQYVNHDDANAGIAFVLDKMKASEKRTITVRYNPYINLKREYKKRTQAELSHKVGGEWKDREYIKGQFENIQQLRVPPEHKDHSWYLRYEGPGWESDKVAYRFYLDQRNATDVFGKRTPEPVLQNIGKDGFDSYHELQPWGMDILKVGLSLGVGSIGSLHNGIAQRVEATDSVDCSILENGTVFSSLETNYHGWKVGEQKTDLKSAISIHAGTRLTKETITLRGVLENICTGIGKDKNAIPVKQTGDAKSFGYLATYGKQSLNKDEVGLAVFFHPASFQKFTEDVHSHIVVLKPANGKVDYFFMAAWILEPGGIKDQQQFEAYLLKTARELANPVRIEVKK